MDGFSYFFLSRELFLCLSSELYGLEISSLIINEDSSLVVVCYAVDRSLSFTVYHIFFETYFSYLCISR